MSALRRFLEGQRIGISVSGDAADLVARGFTSAGMNRFTVRLSRALLAEGATLAFGHDWRPDGVMAAIANAALAYRPPLGTPSDGPSLLNLIPWPDRVSSLDLSSLASLRGTLQVQAAGLPPELEAFEEEALKLGPRAPEFLYLRSRGLTHLRRELERHCQARVAVGGKLRNYQGRLPGIVEEALFALEAGHALYLAGLMGGAAHQLGRVLLEGEDPYSVMADLPLHELYRSRLRLLQTTGRPPSDDAILDPEALARRLASPELRERYLSNGLTEKENRRLLETTLEEEVVNLVLTGTKEVSAPSDSEPR